MQDVREILTATSRTDLCRERLSSRLREGAPQGEQRLEWIEEHMRRVADNYNASVGNLNAVDGHNCDKCNNRGYTQAVERRNGMVYSPMQECECMQIRSALHRIRVSGLESSIKRCTFDAFVERADWQRSMKTSALDYCRAGAKGGHWFFAGGAVGCGKTHICTAIAGELLKSMPLHYMVWTSESTRLKAVINEADEYGPAVHKLKTVDALYIDDFFKPAVDRDGRSVPPTPADIRLAYDIINHRYINHMPTIISSERYLTELIDIDGAVGSRIYEKAKRYCVTIKRDGRKNYRLEGMT